MTTLPREICLKFKEARKARGLNQSALARTVGCQQSAISEFESGKITKLSDETVKRISEFLGIPLTVPGPEQEETVGSLLPSAPAFKVHGYCPNCHCPSNVPYVVEGTLFFRPSRLIASPTGGVRCAQCGEILETRCPVCGAPLNDGACCAVCGGTYVTSTLPDGIDLLAYAETRRGEITRLRALA